MIEVKEFLRKNRGELFSAAQIKEFCGLGGCVWRNLRRIRNHVDSGCEKELGYVDKRSGYLYFFVSKRVKRVGLAEPKVLGSEAFFNHVFNFESDLNKLLVTLDLLKGRLVSVEAYHRLVRKSPSWKAYSRRGDVLRLRKEVFERLEGLK